MIDIAPSVVRPARCPVCGAAAEKFYPYGFVKAMWPCVWFRCKYAYHRAPHGRWLEALPCTNKTEGHETTGNSAPP
jgi:hypothetical protein